MGNPPLIHYEGAIYHVTARGARQEGLLLDDEDRQTFARIVAKAKRKFRFYLLAFCMMTNHFHLLIQVSSHPLDRIMQMIMKCYADYFNRKYGYKGHVFDERYGKRLVRDDRYLAIVISYIHGNPVKAGIVESSWEWPWSSARQFKENGDGLADISAVRELLDDELTQALFEPIFDLPMEAYVSDRLAAVSDELPAGPDLDRIAKNAISGTLFTIEDLRGKSRRMPLPRIRKMFILQALAAGARNQDAAKYLGCSPSYVVEIAASASG